MKLLPKKQDLDKAKNDERKRAIDEGIKLAESVDKLRQAKLNEEKSLREWREANIKAVKVEIDKALEEKGSLLKEVEDARALREQLLKPLDKEWVEVKKAKEEVVKEKESSFIEREQLKLEQEKGRQEWEKVSQAAVRIKQNEQDTEKAKSEAISLKELAQREYEMAHTEHDAQAKVIEEKLSELTQRAKEYEVAQSVIAIREHEVKDKEVELIKREQDLERRMRNFQLAQEVLNKNSSHKLNEIS